MYEEILSGMQCEAAGWVSTVLTGPTHVPVRDVLGSNLCQHIVTQIELWLITYVLTRVRSIDIYGR